MADLTESIFRTITVSRLLIPTDDATSSGGEVTRHRLLGGNYRDCVAIDATAQNDTAAIDTPPSADDARDAINRLDSEHRQQVIDAMLGAGVEANRWTCPDLVAQLKSVDSGSIKAVLCCAVDLDPALPVQDALLEEHALEIAIGVAGLAKLVGAGRAVIALAEDSRRKVVTATKAASAATRVRLDPLLPEYPLAHPSLAMRRSLGIRLPNDVLPTRAGVLFLDAPAALAIGRFFLHAERVTRIPVGIYDRRFNRGHLAWSPVGTRLGDLLAALDIEVRPVDLFAGHMLRDEPAQPDDIFTAATEYAVFASDHHAPVNPDPCVRCGWCAEACPASVHPAGLLEAAQQLDMAMADRFGVRACIECGICTHVCPSRLPLLHAIRGLRRQNVR